MPDSNSYEVDFPTWNPYLDTLMTADGRNLTDDLGLRRVRRDDNHDDIGVVGMIYTLKRNRGENSIATDVDAITAPFGGRAVCGPAKVRVWRGTITCTINLPEQLSDMLSIGMSADKRKAGLTVRSSHDGTKLWSTHAWAMRLRCRNGATGPFSFMAAKRKHTGGIAYTSQQISEYAASLPQQIEQYAQGIRRMHAVRLGRTDLDRFAGEIATARNLKSATSKIVDAVLGASGVYVPESPFTGAYSALQLFEACTAFDTHTRPIREKDSEGIKAVRLDRLLDRDTLGSKAWDVLTVLAPSGES